MFTEVFLIADDFFMHVFWFLLKKKVACKKKVFLRVREELKYALHPKEAFEYKEAFN